MFKYKNFILVWLSVYMFVAIGGWFWSDHKEIFPFFRWSLYSKTPNTLVLPYVLVTQVGTDKLSTPKDIRTLFEVHHVHPVTVNLNVNTLYQSVKENQDLKTHVFFNMLPKGSFYMLCTKTLDLSKANYAKRATIDTIAYIRNQKLMPFED